MFTLIRTEVLRGKITAVAAQSFENFLKAENVIEVNVTPGITKLASEIRNWSSTNMSARNAGMETIRTPDAIHVATACWMAVTEMHTKDQALERLDNRPFGGGQYRVRILRPSIPPGDLFSSRS